MKILLATDGSDFSRSAIEKCCQMIVNPADYAIRIVTSIEYVGPIAFEPFAVSGDYIRDLDAVARKQAAEYVTKAESFIRQRFPEATLDITTKVLTGAPERLIVEEAENWGADLIIMGSHGYGFWERMLLGSVSQSVVNHAPCSVMVARKK